MKDSLAGTKSVIRWKEARFLDRGLWLATRQSFFLAGIDSATAAAIAQQDGFDLYALTFRYGQRHELEIKAAKRVAAWLRVREHLTIDCDLRAIGGSALTDRIKVPKGRSASDMAHGIPITYVPARNTIFLSIG
jgi:7-cyano-7-deazaguanine synthase